MLIQSHIYFISLISFLLFVEIRFILQYIFNLKYDLFHIVYGGIFMMLLEYTYLIIKFYCGLLYKIYKINKINNITNNIIYYRSDIDICSICLHSYVENDIICQVKCSHIYHKSCIDSWINISRNLTCPICRDELLTNN
jgi:hypothetical protein